MKMPKNSNEGAFNITRLRLPEGVTYTLDRYVNGREKFDFLINDLPTMRPLDNRPCEDLPPISPFDKRPPIEMTPFLSFDKLPPLKPVFENWPTTRPAFDNLPPMTSNDGWSHFDFKKFDFKPTPPPPHVHFPVVTTLGCVFAFVALVIAACFARRRARRSLRGRVMQDAVQQSRLSISTDQSSIPSYSRRSSDEREPGRSVNNDLPPPYYECALSSTKKYISEEPPPYTYCKDAEPQVHTRQQNALIENGLKAEALTITSNNSEDVAPGMRTELAFDNGRIVVVERLSLDLNSQNKGTGVTTDDNVEQQSTSHGDCKDNVVYVDETDTVKFDTQ